ncbi:MAG: thrombospondin type 3 repeat-containing protein [bacterium]|nr:thrombospondin type 3 repeat-containing protein [bacterium]
MPPIQSSKISAAVIPGMVTVILLFGGWGITKLVQRARTPAPITLPAASPADLFPAIQPSPNVQLPTVRADTDTDGLPDDLERIYQTNPNIADTDKDGYADGLEVANGYDPTKPAPGDKITIPAPSTSPFDAAQGNRPPTFTEQFLARTGLPSDPRSLLKSDDLGNFVAEANVRGFLPDIPDAQITIVPATGKAAVIRYLDAVSVPQNTKIVPVSAEEISTAFKTLTSTKNSQPLKDLVGKLTQNVEELKKAPAPGEALALHKQYVAAATALKENAEKLLDYQADYVGALVAASRIENLRGVFKAVEDGIKDLEKKYNIT